MKKIAFGRTARNKRAGVSVSILYTNILLDGTPAGYICTFIGRALSGDIVQQGYEHALWSDERIVTIQPTLRRAKEVVRKCLGRG